MKYFHDIHGVELRRDCYAEQFAEPKDVKFMYSVSFYGSCIGEDDNPRRLGETLEKQAKRLLQIAAFLKRKST